MSNMCFNFQSPQFLVLLTERINISFDEVFALLSSNYSYNNSYVKLRLLSVFPQFAWKIVYEGNSYTCLFSWHVPAINTEIIYMQLRVKWCRVVTMVTKCRWRPAIGTHIVSIQNDCCICMKPIHCTKNNIHASGAFNIPMRHESSLITTDKLLVFL